MEGRTINIKLAGSGDIINKAPLMIQPGTTPEDILAECGLKDYDLFVDRTNQKIEPGEDAYAVTKDGDVLIAATPATVGGVGL